MKKILILFLTLFILSSCTSKKEIPDFTMTVFYQDYCHNCEDFKMIAIPKIKNEFANITVNYYNLDEHKELYDSYIDRIDNFDENYLEHVPFIIIDDQIAIVGYSSKDKEEEEIIKEIYCLFNNEPLRQYFVIGEYDLKKVKK